MARDTSETVLNAMLGAAIGAVSGVVVYQFVPKKPKEEYWEPTDGSSLDFHPGDAPPPGWTPDTPARSDGCQTRDSVGQPIACPIADPSDTPSAFQKALLNRAEIELARKTREDRTIAPDNRGRRVDQMMGNVRGTLGGSWCSAAASTWMQEAARDLGVTVPIMVYHPERAGKDGEWVGGDGDPNVLISKFKSGEKPWLQWIDGEAIRQNPSLLQPGMMFFIYDRKKKNRLACHVGIVERVLDGMKAFTTIEGNTGDEKVQDRVDRGTHPTSWDVLLGVGKFLDVPKIV